MLQEMVDRTKALMLMEIEVEEEVTQLEILKFGSLNERCQLFLALDALKESAERLIKMARKGRNLMGKEIVIEMEAQDLTSVETAGHRFKPTVKGYFNIPSKRKRPEDYEAFLEWMRNDHEGQAFLKESFDRGKLNSWCTERLERGLPLPPYLTKYEEPTVKVKGVK